MSVLANLGMINIRLMKQYSFNTASTAYSAIIAMDLEFTGIGIVWNKGLYWFYSNILVFSNYCILVRLAVEPKPIPGPLVMQGEIHHGLDTIPSGLALKSQLAGFKPG